MLASNNAVINTLHWMDKDRLLETSYDGTIRIVDFNAQRLNFVYGLDEDDDCWIQYSAYSPLSKSLYVARSDGDVTALDLRSRTWCLLSLSLSLSLSRTHTIFLTHARAGTKRSGTSNSTTRMPNFKPCRVLPCQAHWNRGGALDP